MVEKLMKIMLCVSAFACIVLCGVCVWLAVALPDASWYFVAILLLLVAVWFSISAYKAIKGKKEK